MNKSTIWEAAELGDIARLEQCVLHEGADIDGAGPDMSTPLVAAISADEDRLDTVQWLIKHGADVNAVNPATRRSPVMEAVAYGKKGIVRALLDAGANYNHALMQAARRRGAKSEQMLEAVREWRPGQEAGHATPTSRPRPGHYSGMKLA